MYKLLDSIIFSLLLVLVGIIVSKVFESYGNSEL